MSDKQKVSFGLIAPAVLFLPLWVAEQKGFLATHGVEASWMICGTTDAATEAVRKGAVDIIMNSPEGSIADRIEGGPLRLIGGLANRPPLSLIASRVRPDRGISRQADRDVIPQGRDLCSRATDAGQTWTLLCGRF